MPTQLSKKEFSKLFDHTLLKPTASESEILNLCEQALEGDFFSVCVLPRWVSLAVKTLQKSDVQVCTVVGFPLGGNTLMSKVFEAQDALENGATELDMVLDSGAYASGDTQAISEEISALQDIVQPNPNSPNSALLKVIIETAHWNRPQIKELSRIVCDQKAAFVKTSTGFASRGASLEDIEDIASVTSGTKTKIKASGGIKTLAQVLEFQKRGVHRIGCSRSFEILKEFQNL